MKNELEVIVDSIDSVLGEGYAKKNPELIGRMLQAESTAFAATILCDTLLSLNGYDNEEPTGTLM